MDKSREQFEDWFVEISHGNGDLTLNICGDYDCFYARNFWLAWQASRAVEIDFTNAYIVCEGENTYSSIDINDV